MTDRVTVLLLEAARESGALAVRDAFRELEILARGCDFTAAEVAAHAGVPRNQRLREALDAVGASDARRLGKWLPRWKGHVIDGLRLEQVSDYDRAGALWRVLPVDTRADSVFLTPTCELSASSSPSRDTGDAK